MAGKAKEVAGAVSGRDDVVVEGQLQQVEAQKRRVAVADEAVADAKPDDAAQAERETDQKAAEQKHAAQAQAEREQAAVRRQQESERAVAARDAQEQEAAGRAAAERRSDELAASRLRDAEALQADATVTEQQSDTGQRRLEREADAADKQAAQLRARTEK